MQRSAFSLVELSIVLVILGLLTGRVLSGQALIRAAQLRTINTDAMRYLAAVQTFRDKYFAIPGDMNNATKFWGAAHATPATCRTTVSTGTATCDGNGNGQVVHTGTSYESMRFWQHLANAGLIEGTYDGVNIFPIARITNSWWNTYWYGQWPGSISEFAGYYGHALEVYDNAGAANITTEEAWNIDTKSDDGIPNTGKIWANKGDATYPCTTRFGQVTETGALYNLSTRGNVCWMYYVNAYQCGIARRNAEKRNILSQNPNDSFVDYVMANKGDTTYPCTTRANQLTDAGAQYNLSHTGKSCYMAFANWF